MSPDRKPEGILFVISAPSGAGKTSLVKALLERDLSLGLSVSCTTRAPRPGEQDGVHYHFLDRGRFETAIANGEFLEHAVVFGNRYGTRARDVTLALESGRDLILEIDWQGARQVRECFPAAVSLFILPPSLGELERRLRGRGTDAPEVVATRLAQARDDMAHCRDYDYLVVNDGFDQALDALTAVVVAERLRASRGRVDVSALLAR